MEKKIQTPRSKPSPKKRGKPGTSAIPAIQSRTSFQGRPEQISSKLNSIYLKLPSLPYFDRQSTALLIFCLAAYSIFVATVYFQTPPPQITYSISEPVLIPTASLPMQPGERYAYKISSQDGNSLSVSYLILPPASCRGVNIEEEATRARNCFSREGRLLSAPQDSNFSHGNRSIVLFSPWMLALSDSSDWRIDGVASSSGINVSMASTIKTVGSYTVAGRGAYAVEMTYPASDGARMYIDKETRVLLLSSEQGVMVQLVSAPFPLDWENASFPG